MKVCELSIESQKKILKNTLNCMGYTKYFNSIDGFLNNHYEKHLQLDALEYYIKDAKAENLINTIVAHTLESDINSRINTYNPQTMDYASDCHLHFSILTDDSDLTQELVNGGALITATEISLAAKYGRASILEILLKANPACNKPQINMPYSYGLTSLLWAPMQNFQGYEADYSRVETLLKSL